jgi:hypothetical protein
LVVLLTAIVVAGGSARLLDLSRNMLLESLWVSYLHARDMVEVPSQALEQALKLASIVGIVDSVLIVGISFVLHCVNIMATAVGFVKLFLSLLAPVCFGSYRAAPGSVNALLDHVTGHEVLNHSVTAVLVESGLLENVQHLIELLFVRVLLDDLELQARVNQLIDPLDRVLEGVLIFHTIMVRAC